MKALVTGHHGYIGSVMTQVLTVAWHEVTGLDTFLHEAADFGPDAPAVSTIRKDIRDVEAEDLRGSMPSSIWPPCSTTRLDAWTNLAPPPPSRRGRSSPSRAMEAARRCK